MAALSIDIGFALHGQRELQASADAAATAGGADIGNNDSNAGAVIYANNYSGIPGANNAIKDLYNVKMASGYPQVQCLNYLKSQNITCSTKARYNAMAVIETATAPTFFGKLFGINQINLTAKSLSAMKGGSAIPANLMVLVDTTPSMDSPDTSGDCARLAAFLDWPGPRRKRTAPSGGVRAFNEPTLSMRPRLDFLRHSHGRQRPKRGG